MIVRCDGERYILEALVSLMEARCLKVTFKEVAILPIAAIGPDETRKPKHTDVTLDLAQVDWHEWTDATKHMDLVRVLVDKGRYVRSKADVQVVADATGKSLKTIYRWIKQFEGDGTITPFLRKERTDKGTGRLRPEVEALIDDAIKRLLLKRTPETFEAVQTDVANSCKKSDLKVPAVSTIRARYLQIAEQKRVESRQGKKVAKKFNQIRGHFPGAEFPLAVVQIDHTPLDLIVVDEVYRKEVGRPTLTIALDIFSRMILGFVVWFEKPSLKTVSLCLTHAVLPKEKWLKRKGIDTSWPCYGIPRKIHTDNAKEFRGTTSAKACKMYGIDLEQRPRGSPEFGGHVERAFRTFLRQTHTLDGTTFSNVRSKFDYDSQEMAILTLAEIEHWLTIYITKVYHHTLHSGIGQSPISKYQEGLLGSDELPGTGLPAMIVDEEKFRLDFLPLIERTVQRDGIRVDNIHYNDEILRRRVNEKDPTNPKKSREFIFRRDPDNISVLYFFDPDVKQYFEIPTAYLGRPPASLWELKAVQRHFREKGLANIDENKIYEGIQEMRSLHEQAAVKTKSARLQNERNRETSKRRAETATAKRERLSKHTAPTPNKDVKAQIDVTAPEVSEVAVEAYDDIDIE